MLIYILLWNPSLLVSKWQACSKHADGTVNLPQCTSLTCLYNIPTGREIKPIHTLPLKPFKSFLTECGKKSNGYRNSINRRWTLSCGVQPLQYHLSAEIRNVNLGGLFGLLWRPQQMTEAPNLGNLWGLCVTGTIFNCFAVLLSQCSTAMSLRAALYLKEFLIQPR